jgi:hypothetical protein
MKKLGLYIMLIFGLTLSLAGQSSYRFFIGVQPDITREIKRNDEKVFSVNVLPLVAQYYFNEDIALRFSSILNLQSDTKELSHVGGQLGMPVYLFARRTDWIMGFFASPVFGLSHNLLTVSNEITCAVEPGYSWVLENGFSMNLGLQLGATYFTAQDEHHGWRNHTGVKFSLGYTFRSH